MLFRRAAGLLALAIVLATSVQGAVAEEFVEGVASYRERMALPRAARFEAVLEDVSLADAPAVEMGRVEIAAPGNPPFHFAIAYDPTKIEERNRYAVRARITVGDSLLFISDTYSPVLTQGAPSNVDVPMRLVPASPKPKSMSIAPPARRPADPAAALGVSLPANFSGEVECDGCEEIEYSLNLWPDHVFNLRRHWMDSDQTQDTIGRWSMDALHDVLALWDGEDKVEFRVVGPGRLRPIGPDRAVAEVNGDETLLMGEAGVVPMELRLPIRGMVTFLADRARIVECLTGRDYPLSHDDDFATLEAAYLAAGVAQGKPLMASFDGGLSDTRTADGGVKSAVVVEKFTGVWPEETCERAMSGTSLTNTYWKILRLGKSELEVAEGAREPHLVLREGETRFTATVGCNQIIGEFSRDGDKLNFGTGTGASTMMACPAPLDIWEQQMIEALSATTSWRVNGQALELLDASGMQIALLQAVALP